MSKTNKKKEKNPVFKKESWAAFRELIQLLGKDMWAWALIFLVFGLTAFIGSFRSYFFGLFIDDVTHGREFFSIHFYMSLVLMLIDIPLFPMREFTVSVFGQRIEVKIRKEIARRITGYTMETVNEQNSGEAVGKIDSALRSVSDFVSYDMSEMFEKICSIVSALTACILLSWKISAAVMLVAPIMMAVQTLLAKPLFKLGKRYNELWGKVIETANEAIVSVDAVKAFNLQKPLRKRLEQGLQQIIKLTVRGGLYEGLNTAASELLSILPMAVAVSTGAVLLFRGELTIGVLVAFISLSSSLIEPIKSFGYTFGRFSRSMGQMTKLRELLHLPAEQSGSQKGNQQAEYAVEFEDVCFGYKNKPEIFKGLSFSIPTGQMVAFAGSSGCGKSTLFNILNMFYPISGGSVRVLGLDLSQWDLSELRNQIAMVSQDTFLFPGTIGENIRFGRLDATDEEVEDACRQAEIWDFIQSQPDKLNTVVGERGVKLSGGQRQRVAIARAILKDAPILLLDEATSALDLETEREIQKSLDKLAQSRTTIVIAHRLSTIKNADKIFCMEDGQIVESGTHDELMSLGGVYSRLYQKQEVLVE